ncbi:hypothetical protein J7K43_05420 [Candidatus Calescamantes bacterium]|nr:hypothetical protein [Candidatus Calescamantes bacterium]
MLIFQKKRNNLTFVREIAVGLEREIQKITEANLQEIFGYQLVSSEFSLHNFRIDTLAFDPESKSFVIIEYKKDRSFSVIDQGYAYLALMLNNKADFILEYNEKMKQNLRRKDIDWSQSKVLFLANSFTPYQKSAINFKDLPIELWEVKVFENNIIVYNKIETPESKESIKVISKHKSSSVVEREIKTYTLDHHLDRIPEEIKYLFYTLREKILNLDPNIKEVIRKKYIGYKITKNFAEVHLKRKCIKIWLDIEKKRLKDPRNLGRDMTGIGHWGTGNVELRLSKEEDLDYIVNLVRQSLIANYKNG